MKRRGLIWWTIDFMESSNEERMLNMRYVLTNNAPWECVITLTHFKSARRTVFKICFQKMDNIGFCICVIASTHFVYA